MLQRKLNLGIDAIVCSMINLTTFSIFSFSIPLYSELKPLFVMDPLLLPNFVYICPENEYSKLFTVLPPFLSIMRTAYLFQMRSSINVNDVSWIEIDS